MHNNTRRRTTTHTQTIVSVDGAHNDAHPGLDFILCVVVFVCFFLFLFYAYDFYWLAVMAASSASVFDVERWLFWGFDDDCNGVVAIAFFMVVIVHLASVVKPLLLCSLLYSQTSFLLYYETCLLFSILKLFVFSFCEYTINVCYVSL